jgi:hypothetical protein
MSQVELERARADFERRWHKTRERLSSELGVEVRRTGWLVLLLAGAVGLATAVAINSARVRRQLGD